jgi:hypothetical protein
MGHDSTSQRQEDAMNRTRRTALTATIAAAIIGGASAVVVANAAEPTAGAETSSAAASGPTPSATSTTDPVEAQLRDSVRSLEDEIAALELVARLATDGTTTRPSPTATRTAAAFDRHGANAGPGNTGFEDDGVHQHRNRGDDADDADDDADDGGHHNRGSDDSGHDGDDDSGHGGHDDGSDDD